MTKTFLFVFAFTVSGCMFWGNKPNPSGPAGNAGDAISLGVASANSTTATQRADVAQARETEKTKQIMSEIRANVQNARSFNQDNPEGIPKEKVDGELAIADSKLSQSEPDPMELAAGQARALLFQQGKTEEARAAYAKAVDDGKALSAELIVAKKATEDAIAERDAARERELTVIKNYKKIVEDNKLEYEKKIKALNDATQRAQVKTLTYAAIGFWVLFGLGLGFGGPAGLKLTWPFAALGTLCLGLAQLVAQVWFMWACAVAVLVALVVAGLWVWNHYKLGTLKQDAEDKAAKLANLTKQLVPALDSAYKNAKDTQKQLLDSLIFNTLSDAMNREEKALVHQIRAETSIEADSVVSAKTNEPITEDETQK